MAVSKRTRYEVLKRDNHTCRYCGATAPDAKLTVDHVLPTSLGGSDAPDNLVAACRDCNAGKGSANPDDALVTQVGEDDMRWAAAIKRASAAMLEEREREAATYAWFLDAWRSWDSALNSLPVDWKHSVDHWIGGGLPKEVLLDCMELALANRTIVQTQVFAYMGGIARKRIQTLHEAARAILEEEGK